MLSLYSYPIPTWSWVLVWARDTGLRYRKIRQIIGDLWILLLLSFCGLFFYINISKLPDRNIVIHIYFTFFIASRPVVNIWWEKLISSYFLGYSSSIFIVVKLSLREREKEKRKGCKKKIIQRKKSTREKIMKERDRKITQRER